MKAILSGRDIKSQKSYTVPTTTSIDETKSYLVELINPQKTMEIYGIVTEANLLYKSQTYDVFYKKTSDSLTQNMKVTIDE